MADERPQITEPFLPAELEESTGGQREDWHEQALVALAKQLGFPSDFYYPLLGAADKLRQGRLLKQALWSVVRAVI